VAPTANAVPAQGVIFERSGAQWVEMDLPSDLAEMDFSAIWGTSATNMFAAAKPGKIIRYDGNVWTTMVSPIEIASLRAISGSGATDVYAVGDNANIWRFTGP
jgi:hypothetical protein